MRAFQSFGAVLLIALLMHLCPSRQGAAAQTGHVSPQVPVRATTFVPTTQPQIQGKAEATPDGNRDAVLNEDILSGITLTEQQRAEIARVQKEMKVRIELVANDNGEKPEQKEAMIEGLRRMERRAVFITLTPAQRAIALKHLQALHPSAQQSAKKLQTLPAR